MTDYTPTTEDIIEFLDWNAPWERSDVEAWIARHDREVASQAIQRVIRKIDRSPAVTWTGQGGARHIAVAILRSEGGEA